MRMGDEYGADTGDYEPNIAYCAKIIEMEYFRTASQIQLQQSNIGLMSALLLTLQFSFLYGFPGVWSSVIQSSYLANQMSDSQKEVLHEVSIY